MENLKLLDKRLEAGAWGAGLVWIGILMLVPGDQNGLGVLGVGLVLLGLNLARFVSGIQINVFSTIVGTLTATLGLVALLRPLLNIPPFELELFPLLLIILGIYLLVPGTKRLDVPNPC